MFAVALMSLCRVVYGVSMRALRDMTENDAKDGFRCINSHKSFIGKHDNLSLLNDILSDRYAKTK